MPAAWTSDASSGEASAPLRSEVFGGSAPTKRCFPRLRSLLELFSSAVAVVATVADMDRKEGQQGLLELGGGVHGCAPMLVC